MREGCSGSVVARCRRLEEVPSPETELAVESEMGRSGTVMQASGRFGDRGWCWRFVGFVVAGARRRMWRGGVASWSFSARPRQGTWSWWAVSIRWTELQRAGGRGRGGRTVRRRSDGDGDGDRAERPWAERRTRKAEPGRTHRNEWQRVAMRDRGGPKARSTVRRRRGARRVDLTGSGQSRGLSRSLESRVSN